MAAFLRVRGGDDVDLQAAVAHRAAVAVGADGVGHLGDPGGIGLGVLDVGDAAVAQVGEVVDD